MRTRKQMRERNKRWVGLARVYLSQKGDVDRVNLSDAEYVAFRIGCSLTEAEWLVKQVRTDQD